MRTNRLPMCRLARLYTGGKGKSLSSRIRVKESLLKNRCELTTCKNLSCVEVLYPTCLWRYEQLHPGARWCIYNNRISGVNPYHAGFLKWNNPPYILVTFHYHFSDIKMRIWSWPDNSIEPGQNAGLALYWWQRLNTFGSGRIRVKCWETVIWPLLWRCDLKTDGTNILQRRSKMCSTFTLCFYIDTVYKM